MGKRRDWIFGMHSLVWRCLLTLRLTISCVWSFWSPPSIFRMRLSLLDWQVGNLPRMYGNSLHQLYPAALFKCTFPFHKQPPWSWYPCYYSIPSIYQPLFSALWVIHWLGVSKDDHTIEHTKLGNGSPIWLIDIDLVHWNFGFNTLCVFGTIESYIHRYVITHSPKLFSDHTA